MVEGFERAGVRSDDEHLAPVGRPQAGADALEIGVERRRGHVVDEAGGLCFAGPGAARVGRAADREDDFLCEDGGGFPGVRDEPVQVADALDVGDAGGDELELDEALRGGVRERGGDFFPEVTAEQVARQVERVPIAGGDGGGVFALPAGGERPGGRGGGVQETRAVFVQPGFEIRALFFLGDELFERRDEQRGATGKPAIRDARPELAGLFEDDDAHRSRGPVFRQQREEMPERVSGRNARTDQREVKNSSHFPPSQTRFP